MKRGAETTGRRGAALRRALKALAVAAIIVLQGTALRAGEPWRAGEEIPGGAWRAGEAVAEGEWPAGSFTATAIDSATRVRIEGRSYKAGCRIALTELRYLRLLHYDFEGRLRRGELICNRAIADDLTAIFRALCEARYPIERMVLIDEYDADDTRSMEADNTSSFNYRTVAGSTTLSKHSRGMAVDINPLYNPCVRRRDGRTTVEPEAGRPYVDRTRPVRGMITRGDLCYELFKARGFTWGGDWHSLKDYQHFEK